MNFVLGFIIVVLVLAIAFAFACLFGWLTMLCLALFGVKAPFWGCVLGFWLLNILFGAARSVGEKP